MPPKNNDTADENTLRDTITAPPEVTVIGRIEGTDETTDGSGVKYLLHAAWTRKTYQCSTRGLKVLRTMDVKVIDDPDNYTV